MTLFEPENNRQDYLKKEKPVRTALQSAPVVIYYQNHVIYEGNISAIT